VPKTAEHLARAKRNLQFAQAFDLDKTPYLDWVVTAYFYSALHLVDALLYFRDHIDPPNHEERRDYVRTKDYLRAINHPYKELKDRSEDARYRIIPFTKAQVEKDVIPLYRKIEAYILPLLPK
jgi:hypothetical protein